MVIEDFGPRRDRILVQQDNPNKKWLILLSILVIGGIIGGVLFFMNRPASEESTTAEETTTPFPTEEPSPTDEPVDRAEYSIEVLNGSETAGEAGRLQEALESAGFSVDSVANADNTDYTTTIIQAKSAVSKTFLDELEEELAKTYTMGSSETLEDSDEHDVVIIIGMESDNTEEASDEADISEDDSSPTPSPSPTASP